MAFRFGQPASFSTLSTRYIKCAVSATQDGSSIDPTIGTVEFAFVGDDVTPGPSDWVIGSWETTSNEYLGRCLVGPEGDTTLVAGSYDVWIRYTKAPETVAEKIGYLVIN